MKKILSITYLDKDKRLDVFLSENIGLSRSKLKHLIDNGCVKVNSRKVRPSYKLKIGEVIELNIYDVKTKPATDIKIPIIYYDNDIVVVNKPPFISVHQGAGEGDVTLIDIISARFQIKKTIGSPERPGIVHRLDKETSGVLVVARTETSFKSLVKQFTLHRVKKTYLAVVEGCLPIDEGEINLPIGRHKTHRERMTVLPGSKRRAITHYKVKERFKNATQIEIDPITGRTHQIRVHFSFMGYPVIADKVYGHPSKLIDRQALHSYIIEFKHPTRDEIVRYFAPIPEDIQQLILALRKE
ncbi:MAG: RluA family pseudouridine synthase [bacterium]